MDSKGIGEGGNHQEICIGLIQADHSQLSVLTVTICGLSALSVVTLYIQCIFQKLTSMEASIWSLSV